jgi:hypothetical protein
MIWACGEMIKNTGDKELHESKEILEKVFEVNIKH